MSVQKYLSELGIVMSGYQVMLLQQDQLEHIADSEYAAWPPSHIYMIARRPRVCFDQDAFMIDRDSIMGRFLVQRGKSFDAHEFILPNHLGIEDARFECPYPHTEVVIFDSADTEITRQKAAFIMLEMGASFSDLLDLEILYVGQAFGANGERAAPDRLKSHDTLQFIYSQAIQRYPDQEIWLVLWRFDQDYVISMNPRSNPTHTDPAETVGRILGAIAKGASENQKITLTEAALIRHFQPTFNKDYKDTFPSEMHKSYGEFYSLDLNAVTVSFSTEEIGCRLWSPAIPSNWRHLATFPLHTPEERRCMFDFFGKGWGANF